MGIIMKHKLVEWLCIDLTLTWLCIRTLVNINKAFFLLKYFWHE